VTPDKHKIVLQQHHLKHISELVVDETILAARFTNGCATSQCKAACCITGVCVDLVERDTILAHAARIQENMGPEQNRDSHSWFESDEVEDLDFPSGRTVPTRLHNGSCVFLNGAGRCVLQMTNSTGGGHLKPFFCLAFPFTLMDGVLVLDEEAKHPQCCGAVPGEGRTIFDVCQRELEFVLGREGYAELKKIAENRSSE
jgi:uncharacterized protein DUF3109